MGALSKVEGAVKGFVRERLGIRTAADLRNLVYVGSPYLVTFLVGWDVTTEENAKLVAALVGAVFSPALALTHTDDGFRRWVYGMLVPLQSVLIGFGIATESQITPVVSAVVALLGGALASSNTPTSRPEDSMPPPPTGGKKAT